jgi:uncharacterized RDD family membrane protein YckC
MAKLIVNPTSSTRREVPLPRTLLSIGRDPSNDLVLPDAMVSRRHAVIELRGTQYFVRDCNSSNGSLVNGDRVSERSLRDGDLVAIGTARLLFREEMDAEEAGAKVVQHPSAPRLQCPGCGSDYRKGDLFCRQCGVQLAQPSAPPKAVCTSCGTAVPLPARFCNACGTALAGKEDGLDPTKPRPVPPEDGAEPPAPAVPAASGVSAESLPEPGPAQDHEPRPAPEGRAGRPQAQPHSGDAPRSSRSPMAAEVPEAAPPPLAEVPKAPAAPAPSASLVPRAAADRSWRQARAARAPREIERPAPRGPSVTAGLGRRFVAGFTDFAIVLAVQAALLAPVAYYWWSRELPRNPQDVPFTPILLSLAFGLLVAVLGGAYFVYFWGTRGATPGKQLLELAVEGVDGAFPIGTPRAALRVLGCLLSGATLGVGFLMAASGGSALHDKIAGTRVVRRERA